MAFPTASVITGGLGPLGTPFDHEYSVPSFVPGQLAVFVIWTSSANVGMSTPSGWTAISNCAQIHNEVFQAWYRFMQAGDASSVIFHVSNSTTKSSFAWRAVFTIAHASTPPEGASSQSTLDPPSLNPAGWDVEDTLWFAILARHGNKTVTGVPSGYALYGADGITGATTNTYGIRGKESAAASEDPSAWTTSPDSGDMSVGTFAVRPAPSGPDGYRIPRRFAGPAQLSASATTLYTAPTNRRAILRHISVHNPTAGSVDLTMSIGSDAASTRLYDGRPLAPDELISMFVRHPLAPGDTIQAFASSAGALVITLSGDEYGLVG